MAHEHAAECRSRKTSSERTMGHAAVVTESESAVHVVDAFEETHVRMFRGNFLCGSQQGCDWRARPCDREAGRQAGCRGRRGGGAEEKKRSTDTALTRKRPCAAGLGGGRWAQREARKLSRRRARHDGESSSDKLTAHELLARLEIDGHYEDAALGGIWLTFIID